MNDLARAVARMFCIGFPGTEVPSSAAALIERGVAGAILFKRNIESAARLAALAAELKSRAGRPFLVSLDQEGGRVRRLRDGFTPVPAMRAVGNAADERLAREIGGLLAAELRAVNVDLDFAPVLDVDTNPANPVIGDRSFSRDPHEVARLGRALIEGLQAGGVAACGKHFPGHGDTSQDSHVDLPRLAHALERLEAVELVPFAEATRAGVAALMTAHVIFEPLDPRYPATMSEPVLRGLLRERLGYDGVVISDDLEMKAITDHYGLEEAVVRGALAGVDLFLVCHSDEVQHRAIDLLVRAVERGHVPRERIDQGCRRVRALLDRWARPPAPLDAGALASAAHRAIVARVLEAEGGQDPTEVV